MDNKVRLDVRELADLYALKTLYDYLKETNFDAQLFFSGSFNTERAQEVLTNAPKNTSTSIDAVVSCFSDIGGGRVDIQCPKLEVDIAILKNCVKPMTQKEESLELGFKKKIIQYKISYSAPEWQQ